MEQFKRLALAVCVLSVALPVQAYGFQVRVTAYTDNPHCTKRVHPDITASDHRIRSSDYYRLIALSPDLAQRFRFGACFLLRINRKVYKVRYQDRMPNSKHRSVDFLLPSIASCKKFGIKKAILTPIRSMRSRPPRSISHSKSTDYKGRKRQRAVDFAVNVDRVLSLQSERDPAIKPVEK